MKIKEIICALERFAPLPLQDGFDNSGLQIGLTDVEATGALLCLDVTESIIDEAIDLGYNLVVSHHPLIFKGLKSITGSDYVERCIIKAIKHDIVIYAAHTNLDNAYGGVNYKIAEILGLTDVKALVPKDDILFKIVTYVPKMHAEKLRTALFEAGCGNIGNYDKCSFNQVGEGTFRALDGANPFVGKIDELHSEEEVKIETIFPSYKKSDVIKALFSSHPYEEPAFDIYSLQNNSSKIGSGIIGTLTNPIKDIDFLNVIKEKFNVGCLKYNQLSDKKISRVAVCGGSGAFLLQNAIKSGADVFITGEYKYHDYFGHENDILMTEIGHYESEQYTSNLLYSLIHESFADLSIKISSVNTNPIKYI